MEFLQNEVSVLPCTCKLSPAKTVSPSLRGIFLLFQLATQNADFEKHFVSSQAGQHKADDCRH